MLRERNFKIQIAIGIGIMIAGIFFKLLPYEWIAILLCFGMVLSLEMLNSAIEKICNFICPDVNDSIKVIKDIAAGAVLIAAFISLLIGMLIFLPKICALF